MMESILETKTFSATANADKGDVLVDQPQQMILGNLIFERDVVEQRF